MLAEFLFLSLSRLSINIKSPDFVIRVKPSYDHNSDRERCRLKIKIPD